MREYMFPFSDPQKRRRRTAPGGCLVQGLLGGEETRQRGIFPQTCKKSGPGSFPQGIPICMAQEKNGDFFAPSGFFRAEHRDLPPEFIRPGKTDGRQRTYAALRHASGDAYRCAQFHQRLIEVSAVPGRKTGKKSIGDGVFVPDQGYVLPEGSQSGTNSKHVPVHSRDG